MIVLLIHDDDVRRTIAAVFYLLYVAGLLVFLAYVPVPPENGNIIHLIIGTLMGAGTGPAMLAMFNKRSMTDEELDLDDPEL